MGAFEVIPYQPENPAALAEEVGNIEIGDEVEPAFAVAKFLIGKAAMLIGEGKQSFAEEGDSMCEDSQFPFVCME